MILKLYFLLAMYGSVPFYFTDIEKRRSYTLMTLSEPSSAEVILFLSFQICFRVNS